MNKVEMDITTDWWSSKHLKWLFSLAIPMFIFYVVGIPAMALIVLYKNRKRLDQPEVLKYIILLYQGLKHSKYYWELVNTLRKTILIALHTFIPDELRIMKALIGCLVMFVISIIQLRIKPFKISIISTLEHREMVSSLLTLYGGLIFAQDDNPISILSIVFFILIILANARFLILWAFCVTTVYRKLKFMEFFHLWIKRAFCIEVDEQDESFLSYKSKVTSEGHHTKSRASHITDVLEKHSTTSIMVPKSIIKNRKSEIGKSQFLDRVMESHYEEPEGTVRTPKKLISSQRDNLGTNSKRLLETTKVKMLKRSKKKKVKHVEELKEDTKFDDSHTIDFFGQKFQKNELDTKMGKHIKARKSIWNGSKD